MSDTSLVNHLVVVGTNHRSSSGALRERIFVEEPAIPRFLAGLREAGLAEAMVLSTGDRVEVITVHGDREEASRVIAAALVERSGLDAGSLATRLYRQSGLEAVRHCFAVASGLDSLVVGEPQVLGQMENALFQARTAGMVGPGLEALLSAAFATALRVQTETAVAEGPVSIASAAVQLAGDLHGDLGRCHGLVVGTGDMGSLIANSLQAAGLTRLVMTAPQDSKAEAAAFDRNSHVVPFADLEGAMVNADIVLTCLNGQKFAIGAEAVRAALTKRRQRPIFLIDAGIPGDIEPAVNRVDNAFLYDLTDLEGVAVAGRTGREAAARAAWGIVTSEVAAFQRVPVRETPVVVPVTAELRRHFEAVRTKVLEEAGSQDATLVTALLVERLLNTPADVLREAGKNRDEREALEGAVRRLFRLEETSLRQREPAPREP
ncbi:MAG: glutamyl-tRNA reductase [Alphaproteobacteria bacterium]